MPPGVAPEPALHPPGTDPYSNSALLPSTYVGLEAQPQFYADPTAAASHNWVVPQADPVGFVSVFLFPSLSVSISIVHVTFLVFGGLSSIGFGLVSGFVEAEVLLFLLFDFCVLCRKFARRRLVNCFALSTAFSHPQIMFNWDFF